MEKSHKKLEVWKKSMELAETIYKLTEKLPKEERYGLAQQMRRAAVSIPSNIAEGSARQGIKEAIQFYLIARGSLSELDTQNELCHNIKFFNDTNFSEISDKMEKVDRLLNGLLKYRKKFLTILFIFLPFYLSTFLPVCFPAFVDLGAGARPLGMGNAFVAVADDANTVMYNPAGLARIKQEELTAMYSKLHTGISGLSDSYVSYVCPINRKYGTLGFALHNFTTKDLYYENILVFSYGRRFVNKPLISAGINLKYLSKEYETNEWTAINPVFSDGTVAHGVSVDLGLLCRPYKSLFVGLSLENLNKPDIGLKSTDRVPANYRFGAAYNIEEFSIIENIITTVETTYRGKEYKIHTGFEGWFLNRTIALRLGFGAGNHTDKDVTAGTGYLFKLKDIEGQVDYAWVYPLGFIEGISGTHRFSMGMRFGKVTEEVEEMEEVSWEEKRIKQEAKSLNESGVKFYKENKFLKAYDEFNKILEVNPKEKKSKKYIKKMKKKMKNIIDKGHFKEKKELFYAKGFLYYISDEIEKAVAQWEEIPDDEEVEEYLERYKDKD